MSQNRTTDLLIGLGIGLAIGAAAALLLAPESGRRTRRRLVRAGEDALETAREGLEAARETAGTRVRKLSETIARS